MMKKLLALAVCAAMILSLCAAAQADIAQGNAGGIADGDINDLAVAGDIERDFPVQSAGIPAHQASKLNGQVFIPFNGEII